MTGLEEIRKLVNEQAEDEGLWFYAKTAPEAYMQMHLRRLHALVEHYTSDQENEDNDCDHHDKSFSVDGIYCKDCGETFEDNTGSNLLGG